MKSDNVIIEAQMMIRQPVENVFNAFVDPAETVNFWFTKSSGVLEQGKKIVRAWEMYQFSTQVLVKEIITNQKIKIEWQVPATTVDFEFKKMPGDATYVVIKNYGFSLKDEELVRAIIDNTGGFTTVLDGLKAWLEHKINLNLIADKFAGERS